MVSELNHFFPRIFRFELKMSLHLYKYAMDEWIHSTIAKIFDALLMYSERNTSIGGQVHITLSLLTAYYILKESRQRRHFI